VSELHRFLFEGLPVRGVWVKLTQEWREVLCRREGSQTSFEPPVRDLLGEMAAAANLLQANIKFDGSLILQIFGDGWVKLAVAEVQPDLAFRVTATVNPTSINTKECPIDFKSLVDKTGQGRCVITLDPQSQLPGQQPYQGVVPLNSEHGQTFSRLSEVLEHYMWQSEQLETRFILAADENVAAGLLLQRLPTEGAGNLGAQSMGVTGEDENEAFNRICHLAASLKREELLTLDVATLLRRLFWEENLRLFEPSYPRFACSCTQGRVTQMIQGLGLREAQEILAEQGQIEVSCEFCGQQYRFDAVDISSLFVPQAVSATSSKTVN
jgi:molecular chaperone Hsp33